MTHKTPLRWLKASCTYLTVSLSQLLALEFVSSVSASSPTLSCLFLFLLSRGMLNSIPFENKKKIFSIQNFWLLRLFFHLRNAITSMFLWKNLLVSLHNGSKVSQMITKALKNILKKWLQNRSPNIPSFARACLKPRVVGDRNAWTWGFPAMLAARHRTLNWWVHR